MGNWRAGHNPATLIDHANEVEYWFPRWPCQPDEYQPSIVPG